MSEKPKLPARKPAGTFVQTERETHEAWAALIGKSPLGAQIVHLLAARVHDHNAVVISQKNLMRLTGASRSGVQNALAILERGRWIQVCQIGPTGTTNAYLLNDKVAWWKGRDELRWSHFSATVVVSSDDQPNRDAIESDEPTTPLRRLPRIGERQMPSGDGLPPPSQPALPDMERELPAAGEQIDIEDFAERATLGREGGDA